MAKKKEENLKVASLNLVRYKVKYLIERMADYNPRTIDEESKSGLSYSIEQFGYLENIVFNKKTKTIVSGHQRIKILHEQGYDEVDVHEINVSLQVEKELNVTLNNKNIQGDFTYELTELLREISETNPELYDMTNMVNLDFDDIADSEEEFEKLISNNKDDDGIAEMELMPYEHYDCVLVVFKRIDDYLYLSSKLGLDEKRIISAPTVKNKKIGKVRAISADKLIEIVKGDKGIDLENFEL